MIKCKYEAVTAKQLNKMAHTIGLVRENIKYNKVVLNRNFYACENNEELNQLVELNLMHKRVSNFNNTDFIYRVTPEGKKFLESVFRVKIIN